MLFQVAVAAVLLISSAFSAGAQSIASKLEIQKMVAALQIIDLAYVDSVDMEEVISGAITKSLKDLDPHSAYIPAEEVEKANEPLEGSFEGIGITFQIYEDTILVISPTPGGPSERLGILSGDKIVKIDGMEATGDTIDNEWVFNRLRGKKGTIVDVAIYRKGKKDLIVFEIERDKIPLNSIDASFMATNQIGYIRLNRFSKTSTEEFIESVKQLKAEGMQQLILDLRGNSGGYLNIAVELADELIEAGKLIVYTEGLHSPRQDYRAGPGGTFETGKLIVIIDEASASASEIVAGAVQDWDRGLVIGRRSFGKGLVQRPFSLPDGSVIRLTTARYYTPSGRCIQRPYENGTEAYYQDLRDRYEHGEYVYADSIKFPDSLKYTTGKGRIVYGGGGIMPDVFIPWDSTWYSDYYVEIRRKGLMNSFTLDYVEDRRTDLTLDYPTLDSFISNFSVEGEIMDRFLARVEDEGVAFDEEGWKASSRLITYQLKAMIGRNLWNISAYYEIMMALDDEFRKAVDLFGDEKAFQNLHIG